MLLFGPSDTAAYKNQVSTSKTVIISVFSICVATCALAILLEARASSRFKPRWMCRLLSRVLPVHARFDLSHSLHFAGSRIWGLGYLIRGPAMIKSGYRKSSRKPFIISTPSNDHIMITSAAAIRELANAPMESMSLHAVAHELLQPKYTMRGFEWKDQRGLDGTGFARALRSLLTSNLSVLLPRLREVLEQTFDKEVHSSKHSKDGHRILNVFPSVKRVVAKTNCVMFFGEKLSRDNEFVAAALQFPQDVIFAAEFLRMSPTCISPIVAYLATNGHKAVKLLVHRLTPIVDARIKLRLDGFNGRTSATFVKPMDCMQWIIDTSPRSNPWTASRMVGELIALWFGSVHQLAMVGTFALDHLSTEPEAVALLRDEVRSFPLSTSSALLELDDLPILNSFLMEASRVSSNDAVSCRRKALKEFHFSDHTVVAAGNWACVPLMAILHDADNFPSPDRFDLYRFVQKADTLNQRKPHESLVYSEPFRFTDVTAKWPIWGIGKTACPGRFYASYILKMLLIHVVKKYNIRIEESGRRSMSWRSSIVPLSTARLEFGLRMDEVNALEVEKDRL